jgi:uncharacterized LabA/DUF88 family protein
MSDVLLFVDVDDLYERTRRANIVLAPSALAQGLRRSARVLGTPGRALACGNFTDAPDAYYPFQADLKEAFRREGFELIESGGDRPAVLEALKAFTDALAATASLHAAGHTCVLVSGDAELVRLVPSALPHTEFRLWIPPTADADLPITTHRVELEHLFDFRASTDTDNRQRAQVLFVDLENVAYSLHNSGYAVDPETLARQFTSYAKQRGPVREAYAYADWQRLPPMVDATGRTVTPDAQRIFETYGIETRYQVNTPGKNNSDMRIADHIRDLPERDPPDRFILVTGDRDFSPVITTLNRQGCDVTVWGVDGSTSPALARIARVEYISAFVPLARRSVVPGDASTDLSDADSSAPGVGAQPDASCPTVWTKLVLVIDDLLKRNNWPWVSQARLANELARYPEFNQAENGDPEQARTILTQAMAFGIINRDRIPNPNPNYPDQFTWACRANPDHPVVAAARLVPARVLAILKFHLLRMPYVAFSYLSQSLARDPDLNVQWLSLDVEAIAQWINFLVLEGWVILNKRPHHKNPGDLVSALVLPPSAQLGQAQVNATGYARFGPPGTPVQEGEAWQRRLEDMRKRMIVSIDCFTVRSQLPWAPVITLRQRLLPFGREETERILRDCQESGEVVVREYPNAQRPVPTRGASLQLDREAVLAVLEERDDMIRQASGLRDQGSVVSHETLVHADIPPDVAALWLSILQQERIILAERLPQGGPQTFVVDMRHPVVHAVLSKTVVPIPSESAQTFALSPGDVASSRHA